MTLRQPEPQVLHAAMNGDERAFQLIMEEYRPHLLWFVRGMVRDRELSEEIAQEVFLSVYRHLPRFSENCLFTTWLYRLARNEALDALRSAGRRPAIDHSYDVAVIEAAQLQNDDIDTLVASIWIAVADLAEPLKRPLLLREVTGLSYREIAETLDIPLSAVKWRIYRARDLIQEAVAQEGTTMTRAAAADALTGDASTARAGNS